MRAFTARELAKLQELLKADWEATRADTKVNNPNGRYSNTFGCRNCGDIWGTSATHNRILRMAQGKSAVETGEEKEESCR